MKSTGPRLRKQGPGAQVLSYNMSSLRAEHASLDAFLGRALSPRELTSVFLPSFTQWSFSLAALAEIGLALRDLGSEVAFGFWAGQTPLPDVGYSCPNWVAALSASRTRDAWTRKALRKAGFPRKAFVRPPISRWQPLGDIPTNPVNVRSKIRQLMYRGSPMGRAILQLRPDHAVPVTDEYRWPQPWLERSILSYAYVFDQVDRFIDDSKVTAVVVSNGRFLHDRAAAEAALARGIAVLYYDYGGADTAFDLTREKTHDWSALQKRMRRLYSAWPDSSAKEIGSSWFEGRRSHTDSANSAFTDAQVKGRGIDAPPGKKVIVFFSSSGDEFAEFELDWAEFFGGQPQALKAVADACAELQDVYLVVRSHPHKRRKAPQDVAEWHAAVAAASPDLHLDEWSDVDSYSLMLQADLVVTYGSTTGVEAAALGRPVMVMGPSAYDELGCAVRPRTFQEVRECVQAPPPPNSDAAMAFGLMMKRRGFSLTRLHRSEDGSLSINGVHLGEPREASKKIAHLLHRMHRRRVSQGAWT